MQHLVYYSFVVGRSLFPKKFSTTFLNPCHAHFSFSVRLSSNTESRISSLIWGPTNTPSLILAGVSRGNLRCKYAKPSPSLSIAFTNCFTKPSLICKGGRRTSSGATRLSHSTFVCPTVNRLTGQSFLT